MKWADEILWGAHLLHRNNYMHERHFQYITSSTSEVPVDWRRLFIDISQDPTHVSPGMFAPQYCTQTHTQSPPKHQCQNAQVGLAASVPVLTNSCRVLLSLPLFPPYLTEHISKSHFPNWEHKYVCKGAFKYTKIYQNKFLTQQEARLW